MHYQRLQNLKWGAIETNQLYLH